MLIYITSSDGMKQRITIDEILEDEWFNNEHQPTRSFQENISSDKVSAGFSEAAEKPFGFYL